MCYPVQCSKCGKTGWGGCGAHVQQVMAKVPASDRCRCNEEKAETQPKKPSPVRALFGLR